MCHHQHTCTVPRTKHLQNTGASGHDISDNCHSLHVSVLCGQAVLVSSQKPIFVVFNFRMLEFVYYTCVSAVVSLGLDIVCHIISTIVTRHLSLQLLHLSDGRQEITEHTVPPAE